MLEFRLCLRFGFTIIGTTQSVNQTSVNDQSILLIFGNASYYKNSCYRYSLADYKLLYSWSSIEVFKCSHFVFLHSTTIKKLNYSFGRRDLHAHTENAKKETDIKQSKTTVFSHCHFDNLNFNLLVS